MAEQKPWASVKDVANDLGIAKDMVLEDPLWLGLVHALSVDHFGLMLRIDAVGTRTRRFCPGIIVTAAQVDRLIDVLHRAANLWAGGA